MAASLWVESEDWEFAELIVDDDDLAVALDVGWHWEWRDFPFTINQFWEFVTASYVMKERYTRLMYLPKWYPEEVPEDVNGELGEFFEISTEEVFDRLGGRWLPTEPENNYPWFEGDDRVERWFALDNPRQVLLGLAATYVLVATTRNLERPVWTLIEVREGDWPRVVYFEGRGLMTRLSATIAEALVRRHP